MAWLCRTMNLLQCNCSLFHAVFNPHCLIMLSSLSIWAGVYSYDYSHYHRQLLCCSVPAHTHTHTVCIKGIWSQQAPFCCKLALKSLSTHMAYDFRMPDLLRTLLPCCMICQFPCDAPLLMGCRKGFKEGASAGCKASMYLLETGSLQMFEFSLTATCLPSAVDACHLQCRSHTGLPALHLDCC